MLDDRRCAMIIERAMKNGCTFSEVFSEERDDFSIDYDSLIKHVASMRTYGAGVYLFNNKRSLYVYTNVLEESILLSIVDKACRILKTAGNAYSGTVRNWMGPESISNPCPVVIYPHDVSFAERIELLRTADSEARGITSSLKGIDLTYFDRDQKVKIMNSDGIRAEDRRVTSRIRFIPRISNEHGSISVFSDYCAAAGFEALRDGKHLDIMRDSIRCMEEGLAAKNAPSGLKTVILEGGSCSGTFFHEACGHQLETTTLLKRGLFWDKRGEQIASAKVTLVDDGTMAGMYGSSRYDDEGFPRQRNVLIKDGILQSFLVDRRGALLLNLDRTGSGRRQDYAHAPGPRMSNTYLAAGNDDEDQMISDTEDGLLVTSIGGGTGGDEFSLLANVAYEIKNGKIGRRVKGAMLTGRGDKTMLNIDRVGKRMVYEQGGGSFCGADSGFIATTTSGPRMRISQMLVGGEG